MNPDQTPGVNSDFAGEIEAAVRRVAEALGGRRPEVGVILGSGLSPKGLDLEAVEEFPCPRELPTPTVSGHRAVWTVGVLEGVEILVMGGRVHPYEGIDLARSTMSIRVLGRLGCRWLVVTNAAGGIREDLHPGSLMRISDHINLLQIPTVQPAPTQGGSDAPPRSLSFYDAAWGDRVDRQAADNALSLARGVYTACPGPAYETKAEIDLVELLGGDAVGMSTVPEVIVAREEEIRVLGVSVISNRAAGRSAVRLDHSEVLLAGREAASRLASLLRWAVACRPAQ